MRPLPSRQRLLALAATGMTGVALAACGSNTSPASSSGSSSGGGGGNAVTIQNFAFSPVTLTVSVGTTVVWTNQDASIHTVTADDKSFDTGNIAPGATGSTMFGKAGTFTYHCTIHQYMTGTVAVR